MAVEIRKLKCAIALEDADGAPVASINYARELAAFPREDPGEPTDEELEATRRDLKRLAGDAIDAQIENRRGLREHRKAEKAAKAGKAKGAGDGV